MKQHSKLFVNLIFVLAVLAIAGVLFALRAAHATGSTLEAELSYGDANTVQDETQLIAPQIRGRLLYAVPYVGRATSLIPGSARSIALFLVAAGLGAYALWMWGSGLRDRRSAKRDVPASHDRPADADDTEITRPIPITNH